MPSAVLEKKPALTKPPVEGQYNLILLNDEIHSFDEVVDALLNTVPVLSDARAEEITLQAHKNGQALVGTFEKLYAEHYQKSLHEDYALGSLVEPA